MLKKKIIENIIFKIKNNIIIERKSDEISYKLSRLIINNFKIDRDVFLKNIQFDRGDEYANFDLKCKFFKDYNLNFPFSIDANADAENIDIEITYNPKEFPKNMNDLVSEVKETIEHELEHVEQQNFEDMYVDDIEIDNNELDYNFKYLTSKVEVPAYVRGLIKRAKTKKITLSDAMDEWYEENKLKFKEPKKEWYLIKKLWMDYAMNSRLNNKVKKFK